jgi:hypothetical protein
MNQSTRNKTDRPHKKLENQGKLSMSRAPKEHGPEPALQAPRRLVRHVQVRRRDSEQEEQDSSHEEDEVEQDVFAIGDEVGYGSGQEASDSPRRHDGGGAEAWVAEPREAEAERKLTRLAGFEGAIVGVGGDGGVVLHGCDLGDRFPQLGVRAWGAESGIAEWGIQ